MRVRLLTVGVVGLLLGGCALPTMPTMPGWVPWLGKAKDPRPAVSSAPTEKTNTIDAPTPGAIRERPADDSDEAITDRIIAVVNNDAITLTELQESIVSYRAENPAGRSGPSDEDLRRDFLTRLIDSRLQLQEADREKVAV